MPATWQPESVTATLYIDTFAWNTEHDSIPVMTVCVGSVLLPRANEWKATKLHVASEGVSYIQYLALLSLFACAF
jgi:hypothetical protein